MNWKKWIIWGVLFFIFSCKNTAPPAYDPVPYVPINQNINLLDGKYNIPNDGGYKYIDGGYRGLLLYRENAKSYKVFERACSNKPSDVCEIIEMDASYLYFSCKCCQSHFDFTGKAISGVAVLPLTQYYNYLQGNSLVITN